jgi:hypothetical protein
MRSRMIQSDRAGVDQSDGDAVIIQGRMAAGMAPKFQGDARGQVVTSDQGNP